LLGRGAWVERAGVGGTVPVRFPSATDPGNAGWHIDGSYDVGSDVGNDDAPTEILVGSHRDVPRVLAPYGDEGTFFGAVASELPESTFERPRAHATGCAGDVYLCHPFLLHRATWPHRGTRPRILAQPEVATRETFALRDGPSVCAVEQSILEALAQAHRGKRSGHIGATRFRLA
jgi:hypothetical protein